jgi:hypothetical protein
MKTGIGNHFEPLWSISDFQNFISLNITYFSKLRLYLPKELFTSIKYRSFRRTDLEVAREISTQMCLLNFRTNLSFVCYVHYTGFMGATNNIELSWSVPYSIDKHIELKYFLLHTFEQPNQKARCWHIYLPLCVENWIQSDSICVSPLAFSVRVIIHLGLRVHVHLYLISLTRDFLYVRLSFISMDCGDQAKISVTTNWQQHMSPGRVSLGIRVSTTVINSSRDKKTKLFKSSVCFPRT